jgi:hypothetical protein
MTGDVRQGKSPISLKEHIFILFYQMARYLINLLKIRVAVRFICSTLSSLLLLTSSYGQNDTTLHKNDTLPGRIYVLQKVNRDGVSLPEIEIREVTVIGRQQQQKSSPRRTRAQLRSYDRLIYNLKKTYPYAVIVRQRLSEVNARLEEIKGEKERRQFLKDVEMDVFGDYEDDMRQMTMTQGKLLIKLIDRETQNTSYNLIKQYRGFLSAAFWQGIARIFGTNLKAEYDPYGEDALIELIVQDIEAGWL